jgi:hypothetical protein
MAPILRMSGAALYERQRVLVALGALEATPGRGPGSGVPLTAENIAAVLISVLAAESLSEVDETIVSLCNATPRALSIKKESALRKRWHGKRKPTFKSELGRVLSSQRLAYDDEASRPHSIGVTRAWKGTIVVGLPVHLDGVSEKTEVFEFMSQDRNSRGAHLPIQVTAEIDLELQKLLDLTCFALAAKEGEDE